MDHVFIAQLKDLAFCSIGLLALFIAWFLVFPWFALVVKYAEKLGNLYERYLDWVKKVLEK